MSKISITLFVVLFSFYLAFATASEIEFQPAKPCPSGRVACTMDLRPYCVKYVDGSIEQKYGSGSCPPCGPTITGIFRGMCPGRTFLDQKPYVKYV